MAVTGEQLGPKLADALGLDTHNLVAFNVTVHVNEVVTVDAEYLAEDGMDTFDKHYKVVDVDEDA